MSKRYFVTGATGCVGSWVVKNLVESGKEVTALVRNPDKLKKLELIMSKDMIGRINVIEGDLTDARAVEEGIIGQKADYIIHLAAMQLPFCKADPVLGAKVNVEGTVRIFEAAKKAQLKSLVYASTTAVYGTLDEYENGEYDNNSELIPHSHYGAYKQADECLAKVYFEEDQISSIGLRPYVVYGPMRDQGMTSTPTMAMKAAVKGEAYEISYGGEFDFQFADDAAKAFIQAAEAQYQGAYCYNFARNQVHMSEVVKAIEEACKEAEGLITYQDSPLPFPRNVSGDELERLIGKLPVTSLKDGVAKSIEIFRKMGGSL